jgi:adenylate cyclase
VSNAPPEPSAAGWWDSLRRRKLVQWGLLYVAGAWGFLQGLEYASDAFQWPPAVRQVALLASLVGLPVVLVLAWYHGDRGEQRFRGTEIAIIALLFLIGGGIFWRYERASDAPASADNAAAPAVTAAPAQPAALPDEKSIAVLPFADMSSEKDQEYMADGLAEELLNLLAKVPDLRVIARTSSFSFKGQNIPIAEIATKLNVAHILEGSVRKSGNKLRVTAQLIRAADSSHLWSQTYDRDLADVFVIQDEVASAIADALQIKFSGGSLARREGGTENLEAYQLYLRARNGEDLYTESSLDAAAEYLQRAMELDPEFASAWLMLAGVIGDKVEKGYIDTKEGTHQARALILHALQLAPDSAAAHGALGDIYLAYDWNWAAAEKETRQALALDPSMPRVRNVAGRLAATLGRWDDAVQHLRAALARDPVHEYVMLNLGITYYRARRFAEAEAALMKLFEISPGFPWTRGILGEALMRQGKLDEAVTIAQEDADDAMRAVSLPIVLWGAGRRDEADTALRAQIEHWGDTGAYFIARSYGHRGDRDLALQWLERAYEQRDPALIEMLGNPNFDSLADDPRFKAFLRKMKLPEWPSQTIAAGT